MFIILKNIFDKLFKIEVWTICFSFYSKKKFIDSEGLVLKKHSEINNNLYSFFADPFIIDNTKKKATLLVEEYNFFKGGQISLLKINLVNRSFTKRILLKSKHFSYPFFLKSKKKLKIFPEMSAEEKNYFFYFDKSKIIKKKNYFNQFNLIDPTILKKKNLYFLFTSKQGINENKNLLIFYSKNLTNSWKKIKKIFPRPDLTNSRSAGRIFKYKKNYYRPSQDCSLGYGSKIVISRILTLNKNNYSFRECFNVSTDKIDENSDGIHHIDFGKNLVFFDKKKYKYTLFKLFYKLFRKLN